MIDKFFGFKQGQKQVFNDQGKRLVVTVVKTLPLKVVSVRKGNNGNNALIVSINREKKGAPLLKEIGLSAGENNYQETNQIGAEQVFKEKEKVKVSGITKGSGFAGVVKRWGFKGGPATHGQSDRERAPGAIGSGTSPGRVWKGKKMAGHMGRANKTISGLTIFKIDQEKQELWITGLIPGKKGGLIRISKMTPLRHPDENQDLSK